MKFALRQLGKSPGFTAIAVLSLALGIGANTAVFSLVNAVLLQTLPVKNPDRLVVFNWMAEENIGPPASSGRRQHDPVTGKLTSTSFSVHTFEQLRAHAESLTDVFAFAPLAGLNVNIDGAAEIVPDGQVASGSYHIGLGVTAAAGRLFRPADDEPAADPVVVISFRYWQRRFGGDLSAIGKSINVNGVPVTIIGVTAPKFHGAAQVGEAIDITLPLSLERRLMRRPEEGSRPKYWWIRIMGRLKPGATAEQACASLEGIFHETAKGHVNIRGPSGSPPVESGVPLPKLGTEPGGQGLYEARRDHRRSLQLLTGLVVLVLLVACANVANLLLARGAARRREIAVRLALGASRARIIRQLVTESALLAGIGAAVGLAFAYWGARTLIAMRPFGAGQLELDTSFDWRVLGFTTAVAIATGLIFGVAPAFRATKLNLTMEFQGGARTLVGRSRSGLAKTLMIVQVALSVVLLVGAGLLVRTLRNLQHVDIGFNRERLLLFTLNAPANGATGPQSLALYERLHERIAQIPNVQRAGFARVPPLSESNWISGVSVPGYAQTREVVHANGIDVHYLATLGIPLLRGRNFTGRDDGGAPKVAIVNQAFARKYFGEEKVEGRRIGMGRPGSDPNIEIVGLLRDAQYAGVKTAPPPTIYVPYAQLPGTNSAAAHFVIRFVGEAASLTPALRAAVREIDAHLPVFNVRTQEEQIRRLFTQERLFANLCGFFGGLALTLSAVGLFGLMSYTIVQRTGEIGLRLALGALPQGVLWMIVRESLGLVVLGALIGIGAACGATRWISSLLFGLTATDPVTYASVAALLFVVGLIACLIPARRAASVDPMTALRTE